MMQTIKKSFFQSCSLLILFVLFLSLIGCQEKDVRTLKVLTWNVQNLFDGDHDGGEYPEYDPNRSSWDMAVYHSRLQKLGEILQKSDADIILLQEIEGEDVLRDLCRYIDSKSYRYFAATHDRNSAIQEGIISRFPITKVTVHRPMTSEFESCRSILKVVIPVGNDRVICFVNHWKSRCGGPLETEPSRIASSRLLRLLIEEEQHIHPDTLILASGDLNTSVQNAPEGLPLSGTSLVPADVFNPAEALQISGNTALVIHDVLYDVWLDDEILSSFGSYWYQGHWYQFDHLMGDYHLFDGVGFDLKSVDVYIQKSLLDAAGHPNRWSCYKRTGVSDHLPMIMELTSVP